MSKSSQWKILKSYDWDKKDVPPILQRACTYLNALLEIERFEVTNALGTERPLHDHVADAFDRSTALLGTDKKNRPYLSAFGILNGLLMTPSFRLGVEIDARGVYVEFFIYQTVL